MISGGKAAGIVDQPLPSSAEFKEKVELHICFPTVASWQGIGWTLHFYGTFLWTEWISLHAKDRYEIKWFVTKFMCFRRETVKMMIMVTGTDLRISSDPSAFYFAKRVGGWDCLHGWWNYGRRSIESSERFVRRQRWSFCFLQKAGSLVPRILSHP